MKARPPVHWGSSGSPDVPIAAAIRRCTRDERAMLGLVLIERLSTVEAAVAMGMPVQRFERSYQALLAGLRRTRVTRDDSLEFRNAA